MGFKNQITKEGAQFLVLERLDDEHALSVVGYFGDPFMAQRHAQLRSEQTGNPCAVLQVLGVTEVYKNPERR